MKIDINIASVLGALMLLMISIIGYFLRSIMGKLSEIEREKNQTAIDIARIKTELKSFHEDQRDHGDKMRAYETSMEALWRGFPDMVNNALKAQFEGINKRLDNLEKDIRAGK